MKKHAKILSALLLLALLVSAIAIAAVAAGETVAPVKEILLPATDEDSGIYKNINLNSSATTQVALVESNAGGAKYILIYDEGAKDSMDVFFATPLKETNAENVQALGTLVFQIDIATAGSYYNCSSIYLNMRNNNSKVIAERGGGSFVNNAIVGKVDGVSKTTPLSTVPYDFQTYTIVMDFVNNIQLAYLDDVLVNEGIVFKGDTGYTFADAVKIDGFRFGPGKGDNSAVGSSIAVANSYAAVYAPNEAISAAIERGAPLSEYPAGFGRDGASDYTAVADQNLFRVGDFMTRDFTAAVSKAKETETAIDLLHDIPSVTYEVAEAVAVNTNGKTFKYTASVGYSASVTENESGEKVVSFTKMDGVKINWYVGTTLAKTETVAYGSAINAPLFNGVVQVPRADGSAKMDGYLVSGWATSADGQAIELPAATAAADYYATGVSQVYAVVVKDNGPVYVDEQIANLQTLYTDHSGATYHLYQDVSWGVVGGSQLEIRDNTVFDLHGNCWSSVQRINTSASVTVQNGSIDIAGTEMFYLAEGRTTTAKVILKDIAGIKRTANKPLMDARAGVITFDNVTTAAADCNSFLISGFARAKAGGSLTLNVKNSDIELPSHIVNYDKIADNETVGFNLILNIENSTLDVNRLMNLAPSNTGVGALSTVTVNISDNSVIKHHADTLAGFGGGIVGENVKFNIMNDVTFDAMPKLDLGSIVYEEGTKLVFVNGQYGVRAEDYICNAEILTDSGEHLIYVDSKFDAALDALLGEGYTLKLLGDMVTVSPEANTDFCHGSYIIDLNTKTFTLQQKFRFVGNGDTSLTFKNGTIKYNWNILNPRAGETYVFDKVVIDVTSGNSAFDLRGGNVTLKNGCKIVASSSVGSKEIFALGNGTGSGCAVLNVSDTIIDFSTLPAGKEIHVFNLRNGNSTETTVTNCTIITNGRIVRTIYNQDRTASPEHIVYFKDCDLAMTAEVGRPMHATDNANYGGKLTISFDNTAIDSADIIDNLISFTYGEGQTLITNAGGRGYKVAVPSVTPSYNLTLKTDFNINVWLPTDQNVVGVKVNGGALIPVEDLEVVDGLYKVSLRGIAANAAAEEQAFTIHYTEGDTTWSVSTSYSVVKYAGKLFASNKSDEAKALVAQAINYVNAAYVYAETEIPVSLDALLTKMGGMTFAALNNSELIPETATDIGTAGAAIKTAQLSLGSEFKFLLNLQESFSGRITLAYAGRTYSYDVLNGTAGGKSVIEVDMKACDLFDEVITVSVNDEATGTYDLTAYANGIENEGDAKLSALLLNLYNYCREADEYAARGTLD